MRGRGCHHYHTASLRHSHRIEHLRQNGSIDLIKKFPLYNACSIAVSGNGLSQFIFYYKRQTRSGNRPVHTFYNETPHSHHPNRIAQIQPHWRSWFSPWPNHVKTSLFCQHNFFNGHLSAVGICEFDWIQAFKKCCFQVNWFPVQIKLIFFYSEFAHSEFA